MKRIILMLTVAAMMVMALAITAPMAFAANSCPNIGGCQTTDNPKKSNDGFTSSNTGKSPVHECNSNPSGKCK